jgi:hypothetical protein
LPVRRNPIGPAQTHPRRRIAGALWLPVRVGYGESVTTVVTTSGGSDRGNHLSCGLGFLCGRRGNAHLGLVHTQSVKEARIASQAALSEASATAQLAREARRDRDLAWQPLLAVEEITQRVQPEAWHLDLTITNVGNAPVVSCLCFAYESSKWGFVRGFSLSPGAQRKVTVDGTREHDGVSFPDGILDPGPDSQKSGPTPGGQRIVVLVCSDVLERRWRFLPGYAPESIPIGERTGRRGPLGRPGLNRCLTGWRRRRWSLTWAHRDPICRRSGGPTATHPASQVRWAT